MLIDINNGTVTKNKLNKKENHWTVEKLICLLFREQTEYKMLLVNQMLNDKSKFQS